MTEKEIKDKLKSINDTVKITKAMQMLSTTRSYRTQRNEDSAKQYFETVDAQVENIFKAEVKDCKLFHPGDGQTVFVVIGGDKGLCGDYNNAVFALADKEIASVEGKVKIYSVGYVTREYYKSKGIHADGSFVHIIAEPSVKDACKIADTLVESFKNDNLKEVRIIYTRYTGNSTKVFSEKLLPYTPYREDNESETVILGQVDLEILLKQHLTAKIYYMITTASNAVNYKRMVAMQEATANGEEMVEELTKSYNRTRQNKITNELNDSVAVLFGKKYE